MILIRWWRVQRAYALLRIALRLKPGLPRHAILATARFSIEHTRFCGRTVPDAILSALEVIRTNGTTKPGW